MKSTQTTRHHGALSNLITLWSVIVAVKGLALICLMLVNATKSPSPPCVTNPLEVFSTISRKKYRIYVFKFMVSPMSWAYFVSDLDEITDSILEVQITEVLGTFSFTYDCLNAMKLTPSLYLSDPLIIVTPSHPPSLIKFNQSDIHQCVLNSTVLMYQLGFSRPTQLLLAFFNNEDAMSSFTIQLNLGSAPTSTFNMLFVYVAVAFFAAILITVIVFIFKRMNSRT